MINAQLSQPTIPCAYPFPAFPDQLTKAVIQPFAGALEKALDGTDREVVNPADDRLIDFLDDFCETTRTVSSSDSFQLANHALFRLSTRKAGRLSLRPVQLKAKERVFHRTSNLTFVSVDRQFQLIFQITRDGCQDTFSGSLSS